MILEEFVMLGTTVPEPSKRDGRVFVCSAGFDRQLRSLVRIYPLARGSAPHRWDFHCVPVERNPQDSRVESWKIAGPRDVDHHEGINSRFIKLGTLKPRERVGLLDGQVVASIQEANEKRLSLAVIHPESLELFFEHKPDAEESPQLSLFDDPQRPQFGAKCFEYIPRLKFRDEGGVHKLMLRDWGCYELMRKRGYDYALDQMASALHLKESSSLLVGNMNNQRTAWLVISVLNGVRQAPSETLFDDQEVL